MALARQFSFSNYDYKNQEKIFLLERLSGNNTIYKDSGFWINYLKFKKDLSSKEIHDNFYSGNNNNSLHKNSKDFLNLLVNLSEAGLEKTFLIKIMEESFHYFNIPMKDCESLKVNFIKF